VPERLRLYLDENVPRAVCLGLQGDHDVYYVADHDDARSRSDAWHFRQASSGARTLITINHADFRFLHRVWTSLRFFGVVAGSHSGILTTTRSPRNTARLLSAMSDRLAIGDILADRFLVWHSDRDEWREDPWRPDD
jgi:hypothetical protein